ncbi:YbgC/FadM family acyl-CoA thioesterase [Ideonella paludis]|uniref:YbgC/FadM family acyl-CoA thioesterase n=1 Tax=Ideonella paludis TaxID=1233411 RepID=A0ABS5DU77_9BURK|nr:YbgC/FadM family acyl-CoA thioesterase [Ideonella paludis]MBQ0934691.1 YbgC/FadM family acyl-CoA thioesterase [Ideonella paludis]
MSDRLPGFRYVERLRVRWVEVDLQKIVFNGHYLMYLDTAMAGYWRALALPYEATFSALNGELFVKKAELEYHAPAELDDLLEIGLACEHVGNSSVRFKAGIFRDRRLLVSGQLIYVYASASAHQRQSLPVPDALRQAFAAFEAGEDMVCVKTGSWAQHAEAAAALRQQVFVIEQGIPAALACDAADEAAVHAVAHNRLGLALAAGRLLPAQAGQGRIGRMAVARGLRGSGVGLRVLNALERAAAQRGDHSVMLHAQASAVGFYLKAGYQAQGEPFTEAGIEHLEMTKRL